MSQSRPRSTPPRAAAAAANKRLVSTSAAAAESSAQSSSTQRFSWGSWFDKHSDKEAVPVTSLKHVSQSQELSIVDTKIKGVVTASAQIYIRYFF